MKKQILIITIIIVMLVAICFCGCTRTLSVKGVLRDKLNHDGELIRVRGYYGRSKVGLFTMHKLYDTSGAFSIALHDIPDSMNTLDVNTHISVYGIFYADDEYISVESFTVI